MKGMFVENTFSNMFSIPSLNICSQTVREMARQGVRRSILPTCQRDGRFDYQQADQRGTYCANPDTGEEIPGTRNHGGRLSCKDTEQISYISYLHLVWRRY